MEFLHGIQEVVWKFEERSIRANMFALLDFDAFRAATYVP